MGYDSKGILVFNLKYEHAISFINLVKFINYYQMPRSISSKLFVITSGGGEANVYGSSYYWNFRTSSFKQVACLILARKPITRCYNISLLLILLGSMVFTLSINLEIFDYIMVYALCKTVSSVSSANHNTYQLLFWSFSEHKFLKKKKHMWRKFLMDV